MWTVLARILSAAKDRGRISINPCERGGRLYESGERLEKVWSESAIQQMIETASAPLVDCHDAGAARQRGISCPERTFSKPGWSSMPPVLSPATCRCAGANAAMTSGL